MVITCDVCGKTFKRKPNYFKQFPKPYRCSHKCRYDIRHRFWEYVKKTHSCWLWTGTPNHNGYGKVQVNGKTQLAHRVAWSICVGPIPDGMSVCHNCPDGDNTLCVNPAHLFLGTQLDNVRDCIRKGRNKLTYCKNITEDSVREIRDTYTRGILNIYGLAKKHSVSPMTICRIVNRKTWSHI